MFSSTLSPYTISLARPLAKYWLVNDKPAARIYVPAQTPLEEQSFHKSMLFHIKAGDYITTLATILRFFQESIHDEKITPEMRELQLASIGNIIKDLLYLNKHYTIVSKDEKKAQKKPDISLKKVKVLNGNML
ncbi:MAG TPA: hypothetical protein VGO63_03525 [Candidatus Paceibacterota bacterium]|jgi:hypothetical protein|nr:hypothetical protein [Candidatus Paceibacterota bacterium]